jgi:hypothetical protein
MRRPRLEGSRTRRRPPVYLVGAFRARSPVILRKAEPGPVATVGDIQAALAVAERVGSRTSPEAAVTLARVARGAAALFAIVAARREQSRGRYEYGRTSMNAASSPVLSPAIGDAAAATVHLP